MSVQSLYQQKLTSAAEAIDLVRDGDLIVIPSGVGEPPTLLGELSAQRRRFHGVQVAQILPLRKYEYFDPATVEHVLHVAYFFGGAFLMNTVPHLVAGASGSPFQSPFASPPGQGLSSSMVNVLWGMVNLLVAYLLLARTGNFELRRTRHVVPFGLGALIMAMMLAHTFGRLHGGLLSVWSSAFTRLWTA